MNAKDRKFFKNPKLFTNTEGKIFVKKHLCRWVEEKFGLPKNTIFPDIPLSEPQKNRICNAKRENCEKYIDVFEHSIAIDILAKADARGEKYE